VSRALAVAAVLGILMLASCSDEATSSRNDPTAEATTSTPAERSSPFSGYRSETYANDGQGTVAACTNPAALGGGEGVLDPYVTGGVAGVTATTPYLRTPDAMRAECASANGITYLGLSSATGPGDVRSVEEALTNVGFWGLHLTESNLTQGNLIEIVCTQTDAQL
jgi:hypothetical protein